MRLPIFVCSAVAAVSGLFQCGGAVRSTPSGAGDAGANTSPVAALPGPSANSASGSVAGGLGGVGFGEAVTGDAGPSAIEPVSGGLVAVGSSTGTCGDAGPGIVPGLVMLASGLTCPWGMAIDATSVYWTTCGDPTGGYVLKVPKAGGEVVTLASGDRLSGIAVDATSVYWVAGTSDASSGAIMKVTVGGGTPKTLATRPGPPAHLALDDSYVYWSEQMGGAIMKVALAGGAPTTVASANLPWNVALDATNVYWLGTGVMKAPKSGGAAAQLSSEALLLPTADLLVNTTNVYFTSGPPGGMSGVSSVSVGGGTVAVVSATSSSVTTPGPIAIDASRVYWADGSGRVYAAPLAGGAAMALATCQDNVDAIAVDETSIYWLVNDSAGYVAKLPLPPPP